MAEANDTPEVPNTEDVTASSTAEASKSDSWWGSSWLQAAKSKSVDLLDTVKKDVTDFALTARDKSVEVFDYVKKDIDEFTQTVQEEVSSTATVLKEKLKFDEASGGVTGSVKRSVTALLHQVSDAFYIPPEDDDEPIFLDRLTAIIYNFGADPATFLIDPESKEFEDWQSSFKIEAQQDDIDALLGNNEKLRQNLETLVPDKVSEQMFWARYLFRIHVAREEETKRQIIRKEAQIRAQADAGASELNWDDDEVVTASGEIPEDLQQKLLADYEKECQGRSVGDDKQSLKCKEKGDMVVVSRTGDSDSASPGKESSNEDDWEDPLGPPSDSKESTQSTKSSGKTKVEHA